MLSFMQMQTLPWQRYWFDDPTPEDIGFLHVPDDEYRSFYPTRVRSLVEINDPCCLLLGDAALGKSTALDQYSRQQGRERVLPVNLLEIESATAFQELLRTNPVFSDWRIGHGNFTLILDSLDELVNARPQVLNSLLRVLRENVGVISVNDELAKSLQGTLLEQKVAGIGSLQWTEVKRAKDDLGDKLFAELCSMFPLARLRLRIICRSTDLPPGLRSQLMELFDEVATYHLAPLRVEDIKIAAEAVGVSSVDFLKGITQRNLEGLAARPMSLFPMLEIFKDTGQLGRDVADLYLRMCRSHVIEADEQRFTVTWTTSSEERLLVASRLAYFMFFSNAVMVTQRVEASSGMLSAAFIEYRLEHMGDSSYQITPVALTETLQTALFSGPAERHWRWAHRSFGEFLAAYYLNQRGFSVTVMVQLLFSTITGRVVPQLREIAIHLANLNIDFRSFLLEHDLLTALHADPSGFQQEQRVQVVESLLDQSALALPHPVDLTRLLWKLMHPQLAAQLRPVLQSRSRPFSVRELAVYIARDCPTLELAETLVSLARDPREPIRLRAQAIRAIGSLMQPEITEQVRPLLQMEMPDDSSDNLRGVLLQLLWPRHLSPIELFQVLTPAKRQGYSGAYQVFLRRDAKSFASYLLPAFSRVQKSGVDRKSRLQYGVSCNERHPEPTPPR